MSSNVHIHKLTAFSTGQRGLCNESRRSSSLELSSDDPSKSNLSMPNIPQYVMTRPSPASVLGSRTVRKPGRNSTLKNSFKSSTEVSSPQFPHHPKHHWQKSSRAAWCSRATGSVPRGPRGRRASPAPRQTARSLGPSAGVGSPRPQ